MKHLIWTSSLAMATLGCVSARAMAADNDSLRLAELQEVTVKGVRAMPNAPFAVANISKTQLKDFSRTGQELPFLFARTPGVLAWSENGMGIGTTHMRIRGAGGSRINVTLDGVSLNSPEDQTVFWANMNSYAALLGSAQIQRGVGTSTNGDGAFGGSISLGMAAPGEVPSLEVTGAYGSYNTYNAGANFSTGLILNRLIIDGAYHHTATDGFLHGTSGSAGSYYAGLTWLGDKYTLRYKNVGNYEHTGQAWNGVTAGNNDYSMNSLLGIRTYEDMYKAGMGKYNSLYEGFHPDWKGGWTTERYKMDDGTLWEKATDNFVQNHNILSATWKPSARWTHNAALHYTYGHGYYREYRPNYKFEKFGMVTIPTLQILSPPFNPIVKKANFVRRKGLTQHTYGLIYNANYTDGRWDAIAGVNLQQFRGNHFGFIDYISNVGQREGKVGFLAPYKDGRYYDSDADKNDYSAYVKAAYRISGRWDAFADLQYRHVDYKTDGINDKFYKQSDGLYANQRLDIDKSFNFFNPKAGVNFHLGGHRAYASAAYAGREPERNNYTDNGSYPTPSAEHLLDFELGYSYSAGNWHAGANLYYMNYKDQFVQTGAKSDIGEYLTVNIDKSYRMGIELSADWSPTPWLTLAGNAALSENRIKDFDEVVETYDGNWHEQDPTTVHYDNSVLAFSPSAILNGFVDIHVGGFQAVWHTNFVSRQYLDNTKNRDRSLPSYTQTNIKMNYTWNVAKRFAGLKEVVIGVNLNNIFDRHYASGGWSYSAIVGKDYPADKRYYQLGYMPMAGFTAMGSLTLRF